MLDAEGSVTSAVTARIRSGWKKFRELAPFLTSRAPTPKLKGTVYAACVRTSMTYGSETWALTSCLEQKLERAEAQMVCWMAGVTLQVRRPTDELLRSLGLDSILKVITRSRLHWFSHILKKNTEEWVRKITDMMIEGPCRPGRPQKTWQELVASDLRRLRLRPSDADDKEGWRQAIHKATSNLGPPRRRTLNSR